MTTKEKYVIILLHRNNQKHINYNIRYFIVGVIMNKEREYMKTKYATMNSEWYLKKKQERMNALKKARISRSINDARDYLVLANAISGKNRIDSRKKIISRGAKIENGTGEQNIQ